MNTPKKESSQKEWEKERNNKQKERLRKKRHMNDVCKSVTIVCTFLVSTATRRRNGRISYKKSENKHHKKEPTKTRMKREKRKTKPETLWKHSILVVTLYYIIERYMKRMKKTKRNITTRAIERRTSPCSMRKLLVLLAPLAYCLRSSLSQCHWLSVLKWWHKRTSRRWRKILNMIQKYTLIYSSMLRYEQFLYGFRLLFKSYSVGLVAFFKILFVCLNSRTLNRKKKYFTSIRAFEVHF